MIPIDLYNADVAGYQIFYFLLITKALYLIFYNYFQSSVKSRIRMFKVLKLLSYFLFIVLYLLWIYIAVNQYFHNDFNDFKFNRVYWKVVTMFVVLVILSILIFVLLPTLSKGIRFLKKKDKNEVKYQTIFKKIRTCLIVLIYIDVVMLLFLNRVVS
jgi:hypothetical protein